jgi:hypothetical protein
MKSILLVISAWNRICFMNNKINFRGHISYEKKQVLSTGFLSIMMPIHVPELESWPNLLPMSGDYCRAEFHNRYSTLLPPHSQQRFSCLINWLPHYTSERLLVITLPCHFYKIRTATLDQPNLYFLLKLSHLWGWPCITNVLFPSSGQSRSGLSSQSLDCLASLGISRTH